MEKQRKQPSSLEINERQYYGLSVRAWAFAAGTGILAGLVALVLESGQLSREVIVGITVGVITVLTVYLILAAVN